MSHWDEFDYVIINDDLETAIDELEAILRGGQDSNKTSNPALRKRVSAILR
jgi:guanylate kinase